MFENPRRSRQPRNFTTNAPKILDLNSSSEQIFSRKLSLGAPTHYPIRIDFVPPLNSYRSLGLLFSHNLNGCGSVISATASKSKLPGADLIGGGASWSRRSSRVRRLPPTTNPKKNLRWGHVLVPKNTFTDVFDKTCDIGDSERMHVRELTQRRRRQLQKGNLKSEFVLPRTLSRLFHLV